MTGTPYLPADFQPKVLLQVDFPGSGASVQLGNTLQPSDGASEPVVTFVTEDGAGEDTYTLVSFDPDAPSRENQEFGPWRHGIWPGLKPRSVEEISSAVEKVGEQNLADKNLVQKTEEPLSPWVAPSPGQGTGYVGMCVHVRTFHLTYFTSLHRYCFALYKQTKPLLPMSEQSTLAGNERPHRRRFDVAGFAKENGLELVGFNYFLVCSKALSQTRARLLTCLLNFPGLLRSLMILCSVSLIVREPLNARAVCNVSEAVRWCPCHVIVGRRGALKTDLGA